MNLGALDATQHASVSNDYGVRGYPTIKYFPAGSTEPEDYEGGRTADDIVAWAEEKAAEDVAPPEVSNIYTNTTYNKWSSISFILNFY